MPVHGNAAIRGRLDHVEEVGRQRRAQSGHPTSLLEADDGQRGRAEEQDHGLEQLRVDDRGEPAKHRVNPRRDHHHRRRRVEIPPEHRLQHERARVERHRNLRDDVGDDRDGGEIPATGRTVAALEELRHRVDAAAEIERHEHPRQNHRHEDREPFERPHRQPRARPGARQPDEVLARDVRGKERRADRDPADAAVGKKVALARLRALEEVHADAEHDREVGDQDDEVDGVHS